MLVCIIIIPIQWNGCVKLGITQVWHECFQFIKFCLRHFRQTNTITIICLQIGQFTPLPFMSKFFWCVLRFTAVMAIFHYMFACKHTHKWISVSYLCVSMSTHMKRREKKQLQTKQNSMGENKQQMLSSTVNTLWPTGPRLNIKTILSTYGDFHVKDKTAVRTSYL